VQNIIQMRAIYTITYLLISLTLSAQTSDQLNQHRLQYKTDLYDKIKADTSKVDFFPFKANQIITAKVEILKDQLVFKMITSSGMKKEAQKFVKITFNYKRAKHTLIGYQLVKLKESTQYADHFFMPFKDATTGKTTYSSGRYLDFTFADIKDGKIILDFNNAYNPYCAFTDGYNCPIPPKENTLKFAVMAGEKKYKGTRKSAE
jgi:uncharacterized protein